ncbi:hypothetical protein [Granulicoccus sp. GXG6511]|uniref:hypothetical protein n=1 Tax=Granulicoccus sp. GXG6511 TaxID=3381351 RepID=UPI003D7C6031
MRTAFKALAYVICGLVGLQAASHAWSSAGVAKYLGEGGTIDMAAEGAPPFPEAAGFMIHAMTGMFVIPLLALILLGVSLAAKIPGAAKLAGIVLILTVLQVLLGMFGHGMTTLAFLHGLNALALFAAALLAGRLAGRRRATSDARVAAPAGIA